LDDSSLLNKVLKPEQSLFVAIVHIDFGAFLFAASHKFDLLLLDYLTGHFVVARNEIFRLVNQNVSSFGTHNHQAQIWNNVDGRDDPFRLAKFAD
jgi:hypothetical protein